MKNLFISYFFLILFCFIKVNPITQMIQSFNEANFLNEADQDTLVVFDIDKTLLIAEEIAFNIMDPLVEKIEKAFKDNKNSELYKKIYTTLSNYKVILLEEIIKDIIDNIQKNQIKIIALTNVLTQTTTHIPNMGKLRFNQLKQFGIDFSNSFNCENLILKNLKENQNSYPEFYKGILMTNFLDKGIVLVEFLKQMNFIPKKIIFLDDSIKNIVNVEKVLNKWNPKIEYIGYHYINYELNSKFPNQKILKQQIDYLLKTGYWIPEQNFSFSFDQII